MSLSVLSNSSVCSSTQQRFVVNEDYVGSHNPTKVEALDASTQQRDEVDVCRMFCSSQELCECSKSPLVQSFNNTKTITVMNNFNLFML
ncbi:unnamed protein product [Arabis nemorensis]|uniref:Uncharacterized protein n=1 Tax=Arabis nemorensis TaxID=586526 RepID=A0A565BYY1_9BRAS|nr:unnamed protein product [Arabis nemorensis]